LAARDQNVAITDQIPAVRRLPAHTINATFMNAVHRLDEADDDQRSKDIHDLAGNEQQEHDGNDDVSVNQPQTFFPLLRHLLAPDIRSSGVLRYCGACQTNLLLGRMTGAARRRLTKTERQCSAKGTLRLPPSTLGASGLADSHTNAPLESWVSPAAHWHQSPRSCLTWAVIILVPWSES